MAEMKTKMLNGIDTEGLADLIERIKQNPELAQFRFRARNRWQGGTHNQTRIDSYYGMGNEQMHARAFLANCDEPRDLGGDDTFPGPADWLLHALAGCVCTTLVAHAAARGIAIQSIETELDGEMDVRGFLGASPDAPKGYKSIHVIMHVKSDAPVEQLKQLAEFSPIFNTLRDPVDVTVDVQKA